MIDLTDCRPIMTQARESLSALRLRTGWAMARAAHRLCWACGVSVQVAGIAPDTVRQALRHHIACVHGSQAAAAAAWGQQPSAVSDILRGARTLPDWALAPIGLRRIVRVEYWPTDTDPDAFDAPAS